jgi:hypothetical protein
MLAGLFIRFKLRCGNVLAILCERGSNGGSSSDVTFVLVVLVVVVVVVVVAIVWVIFLRSN